MEWTRGRGVDHMVRYDLQPDGRHTSAANVSIVGRDVRNAWGLLVMIIDVRSRRP